jgi:hypothetical protein
MADVWIYETAIVSSEHLHNLLENQMGNGRSCIMSHTGHRGTNMDVLLLE